MSFISGFTSANKEWAQHDARSFLVIGLDDIHPESLSNGCDCGGDLDRGVLGLLLNFLGKHPQVKVTLFITPNWIYKPQIYGLGFVQDKFIHSWIVNSLRIPEKLILRAFVRPLEYNSYLISHEKYSNWCAYLQKLVSQGRIAIGIHGLYHFQARPSYSSEFLYLGYDKARERLKLAKKLLIEAGLSFEGGFSPPGWGINKAVLQGLADENYLYIAGSADFKTHVTEDAIINEAGIHNVSLIYPCFIYRTLVNIPRNWSIGRNNLKRIKDIIRHNGLIGIHGHIENEYRGTLLGNGVTPENMSKLEEVVDYLEVEYPDEIWYATFGEVASYFLKSSL